MINKLLKKYLSFTITMCFLFIIVQAQQKAKSAYFEGSIKTDQDSLKIYIFYIKDYITGFSPERVSFYPKLDKKGKFHFSIPELNHPVRLFIQDFESGATIIDFQLVEPNDSIGMQVHIKDGNNLKIDFTGRGSAKYNCFRIISSINDDFINNETDLKRNIDLADSVLEIKLAILNNFRTKISPNGYQIIKADIIGDIQNKVLLGAAGFINIFSKTLSKPKTYEFQKAFNEFVTQKIPGKDEIIFLSEKYITFLYNKEKLDLAYSKEGAKYEFGDLYNKIKNNYSGSVRQKLLAFTLLNTPEIEQFYFGCDADTLVICLKDALSLIRINFLRKAVLQELATRAKGASAFDFILYADSSRTHVKLSDFVGKVVLIDFWAYQCTACYLFSSIFHERVYPVFKSNPNFVVVSIMVDESSRNAYMRRLRQEGGVKYTSPDYVNLFAGLGESMGFDLRSHYRIDEMPFVLLIDKKSKIYSSTIPFFINSDSEKIEKLILLIKEVLTKI